MINIENTKYIIKVNDDKSVVTVKDVQTILLKIMVEFDRICNKHNLDYALAFGSMLGAVRHNGFIPWDDDIDILMTRTEYLKLVEILKTELKSPFYFQCFEIDDRYNSTIPNMKIKIQNTFIKENTLIKNRLKGDGIFIDIFVFDSVSPNKYVHMFHQLTAILIAPLIILLDLLKVKRNYFNTLLYKYSLWYAKKYQDSPYAFQSLSWVYNNWNARLKKTDMFPSIPWDFEGYKFRIANNYDKVLKEMYGDYKKLPSAKGQIPKHIKDIKIDI